MAGFTAAQLQALKDAIASGELSVKYDGKEVTYRSMSELIAAHDLVKSELEAAGTIAAESGPRVSYATFERE